MVKPEDLINEGKCIKIDHFPLKDIVNTII